MSYYIVILSDNEIQKLNGLIQKAGKHYCKKHVVKEWCISKAEAKFVISMEAITSAHMILSVLLSV